MNFIDLSESNIFGKIALEKIGFNCLLSSVNEKNKEFYDFYYNDDKSILNIEDVKYQDIPDTDLVISNFDNFFYTVNLLKNKNTPYFLFYANRDYIIFNNDEQLKIIKNIFNNYNIFEYKLNCLNIGVPYNKEQVFIFGIRKDIKINKISLDVPDIKMKSIWDYLINTEKQNIDRNVLKKYINKINEYNKNDKLSFEQLFIKNMIIDTRKINDINRKNILDEINTYIEKDNVYFIKNGKLRKITNAEVLAIHGIEIEKSKEIVKNFNEEFLSEYIENIPSIDLIIFVMSNFKNLL